jgi:hypothetical protein
LADRCVSADLKGNTEPVDARIIAARTLSRWAWMSVDRTGFGAVFLPICNRRYFSGISLLRHAIRTFFVMKARHIR